VERKGFGYGNMMKNWKVFGKGNEVAVGLEMKKCKIWNENERIGVRFFGVAKTPFLGF